MPINLYKQHHLEIFESKEVNTLIGEAVNFLKSTKKVFFIGNGGSNAICSHMMEDFAKMGRFQTYSFSDPALITCYANDYGYENALMEWLKIYLEPGDLLIAISSSGNSMNIINATEFAKEVGAKVIGLSGFKPDNKLRSLGDVSFYIGAESYGVVECLHHTILHIILDQYVDQ